MNWRLTLWLSSWPACLCFTSSFRSLCSLFFVLLLLLFHSPSSLPLPCLHVYVPALPTNKNKTYERNPCEGDCDIFCIVNYANKFLKNHLLAVITILNMEESVVSTAADSSTQKEFMEIPTLVIPYSCHSPPPQIIQNVLGELFSEYFGAGRGQYLFSLLRCLSLSLIFSSVSLLSTFVISLIFFCSLSISLCPCPPSSSYLERGQHHLKMRHRWLRQPECPHYRSEICSSRQRCHYMCATDRECPQFWELHDQLSFVNEKPTSIKKGPSRSEGSQLWKCSGP